MSDPKERTLKFVGPDGTAVEFTQDELMARLAAALAEVDKLGIHKCPTPEEAP